VLVLVTYDVRTETRPGRRRLRRVAKICEDFGVRVQKSVFECLVDGAGVVELRARLISTIEPTEDSLRFYFLDRAAQARIEHHGAGKPTDLEGPLVV